MTEALFIALISAVSALLLRQFGWRGVPVFVSLCLVLLLSDIFATVSSVFEFMRSIPAAEESAEAIVKIIGVGYLFGISADLCRELGESSIASAVILLGRMETVAIALPFIIEIAEIALSLLD